MEATKNLCAQIPEALHARVRTEQEQSGQTLSQYVTELITEYYQQKEGRKMDGTRTMAFQIPEELFQRIKRYLDSETERTGKKLSQREFVLGLIQQAMTKRISNKQYKPWGCRKAAPKLLEVIFCTCTPTT